MGDNETRDKHPCKVDCPERRGGCAVTCAKWQKYEKARNANYEERSRQKFINQTDTYAKQKRMERQDKAYISLRKVGKKLNGSI